MAFPKMIDNAELSSFKWWGAHRGQYNLGLLGAGVLAFLIYVLVARLLPPPVIARLLPTELLPFIFLQLAIDAFAIGMANVCYLAGPFLEEVDQPRKPDNFRRAAYTLGFWFSFAVSLYLLFPGVVMVYLETFFYPIQR